MENEYLTSDTAQRWLKYDHQLRTTWPHHVPPVSEQLLVEIAKTPADDVRLSIKELQNGLATLNLHVSKLRQLIILAAAVLAFLIYFRLRY
jgi:hypothetical protein